MDRPRMRTIRILMGRDRTKTARMRTARARMKTARTKTIRTKTAVRIRRRV